MYPSYLIVLPVHPVLVVRKSRKDRTNSGFENHLCITTDGDYAFPTGCTITEKFTFRNYPNFYLHKFNTSALGIRP